MNKILFILATSASLIFINNVSAEPNSIPTEIGITFATLTTTVNGDQPDHLVNATISDGKYKGAKLHGKLDTTKGRASDPDRICLHFTSMDMNDQSKPVKISAYAIDANTVRTALSGNVSSEYLQHNGIILAASFIQGYAQKHNQSLSGHSNLVKINAGTDIGILFLSK